MDDVKVRMMQLAIKGYYCSQILILLGLEARGKNNPELVRAMHGLAGGCDEGSCTCGSLTGGCCLIALFCGKGSDSEQHNRQYHHMIQELVQWFWNTYGFKYGGIDCIAIREGEGPETIRQRCWQIMENVYFKAMAILAANGIVINYKDCYAG